MKIEINKKTQYGSYAKGWLIQDRKSLGELVLSSEEMSYITRQPDENQPVVLNRYTELILIVFSDLSKEDGAFQEHCRKKGNEIAAILRKENINQIDLTVNSENIKGIIALAEGLSLGSYQFNKYRSVASGTPWSLTQINFVGEPILQSQVNELSVLVQAVFIARDLVNEPASHLNSVKLSECFVALGASSGFESDIYHKDKIKALGMGGLIAVNQGSIDPPTFSVLTWKPANAKNLKPIILVGKGVVYDTGGLSLKPTKDSMDYMKCDMAGGAVVAAVLYFAAKCNLPLNLIALIPATDNRPDGNAYAPGDVIVMHNGKSVEVLNTDAEGRLILADALSLAKEYDPELVIDVATLTGSASMAIGHQGIVAMGNAGESLFGSLKKSGENTWERIVEFPLWDEYGELIKSDIADMKNVGSREAGAITAGKFLENFVDYKWIHLDIAGPAFLNAPDHYRPKGGTASGVRLLIDFLKQLI